MNHLITLKTKFYNSKPTGFKQEDLINTATEFAKQARLNKIKLLKGNFYVYDQIQLNNLEIESNEFQQTIESNEIDFTINPDLRPQGNLQTISGSNTISLH
ncbi:hypothetical protein [Borreliella andersonii]|uniref:hypothetical protein n=1 Tax=Borrelia andersonii TaxID=42109 RepID=UPI003AB185A3